MKTFHQISLLLLIFALSSCTSIPSQLSLDFRTSPETARIITITKVKKPWYAWRGLIVRKMQETVPDYQALPGLAFKYYSVAENEKQFGGIYGWKTEQHARDWFNSAWFERTEKKYGEKVGVDYYAVKSSMTLDLTPVSNQWVCVLSSASSTLAGGAPGLVQLFELTDTSNSTLYLSLWLNDKTARLFFSETGMKNEYFTIPILLSNK